MPKRCLTTIQPRREGGRRIEDESEVAAEGLSRAMNVSHAMTGQESDWSIDENLDGSL
jgi:hypothetical protein